MANTSKELICGLIGNLFIPSPETITADNIHFWNVTEGWLQAIIELREAVTNFQHHLSPISVQTIIAILVQLNELYNILIEARKTLNARTTIETWLIRLKFHTPVGQLINGFLNLPRPIPPTVNILPPSLLINTFPLPCFEGPLAMFLSKGLQINTHTRQQCFPICPERKKNI